ncbi:substrate-binding domain-containing protein [Sinorhizobium meliloti]|uniref:LacI family DNA-binding transcriptional regulator n=1 Tax=Rhizobium meliloti TaxID=382 RepID=UPI0002D3F1F9|nr:LacI family DNA-binding transcriptional regulator [Sinorhizobium meliloti]ASJ60855.1 LacI family transcriptional regulator [Sinorhizobium meliloti]MCK3781494.1 LacI family DNA-binding transcriptional regulator [Sinorhizobium meliloti]MCK3789879.1 LacI family DNA-binding transcriptional regulator [Sinorhizobium meliloti]MCK3796224.1 LacI family DNA-binding transcriptional regulator [Sinorhizobium meliloti]MCO5960576.1 LacI family transcriptional regulator [Sinorhizobium meliloti]
MGKERVTVVDIARAAGVSKSTVSLVLQASPLVNESTRAKVNAVIRELGYVYNRSAANLRQARSKIIGIVVNDLTNSFFAELAVGVDEVVQTAGFVQFLANTSEKLDRQREVIASMREHGVSGLIISPARGTEAADLAPLVAAGIPVVLVVRDIPGAGVSSLSSDNHAGAVAAVRHLVERGHRRVAFLGGFADTAVFEARMRGYGDALREAGLEVSDDLIIGSAPSRAGGVTAIEQAMMLKERPTAALCFNDAVAFGVCDGLRARRLEPGEDFAVIGFDDVIEAKTAVPALTTVSVDPQGMGERAAELLLKQINSGRVEPEAIVSPVRLAIRQSCGAAVGRRVKEISS